tara:strand:+ start:1543 stop:1701 length:159 start_codon:yes stop_codon:yes gene_type:complete
MTSKHTIKNNLIEIINEDPNKLETIIDEIVSKLDTNQLNQIEDLITNTYSID